MSLGRIGKIEKIEFHILEPWGIPLKRVEALDKGMIFDLFCHVLAIVGAVIDQNLTPSASILPTVELREVKAARYINCPISGETFARTEFIIDNIEVVSAIGKGVGIAEDKLMIISGSKGKIKLDIAKDDFLVFDHHGNQQGQGKLEPRHVESFLEAVLQRGNSILAPGVLGFDAALEILDKDERLIERMPQYCVGEPIGKILSKFNHFPPIPPF
jgi:hypothetical protein